MKKSAMDFWFWKTYTLHQFRTWKLSSEIIVIEFHFTDVKKIELNFKFFIIYYYLVTFN